MRLSSTNMQARKMLFAAIPSICDFFVKAVKALALLTADPDLANSMLPGSSHEPSDDSSSAPSALEERANELIQENLKEKGDLGDGQRVSEVRQAVERDFHIENKIGEFELIKQMEKETRAKKEDSPVTNSTFNEIKDYESQIQDGRGGGKPV